MPMRVNNLSARLMVNNWLKQQGIEPISGAVSYVEFAQRLRQIVAPEQVQVAFVDRADAVRYVRHVASQYASKRKSLPVS